MPGGAVRAAAPVDSALQPDVLGGWVSEYLVVQFRPEVIEASARLSGSKLAIGEASLLQSISPALQATYARFSAGRIHRAYPHEFGNPQLAAQLGLDRIYLVDVPPGTDVPAMAVEFASHGDQVESAGVDRLGGPALFIPDDRDFDRQYGMHNEGQTGGTIDADIDAPEAWEIHTGDYGTVTIAIIDTGVDPHPEFADRMVPGINTIPIEDPNLTTDRSDHGTHVAGIAAAEGNNAVGIAGVTWGALIMPVRVFSQSGGSTSRVAALGLIWAADHGADVCNLSIQYYNLDSAAEQFFRGAVDYAHGLGAVVIAAAGNTQGGEVAAPARFQNCIAVSYTDDNDFIGYFSSIGDEVDVCAAGDAVWSTVPGDDYAHKTGTSMASPAVSGLAALVKSYAPHLTNDGIRDVLGSTADDLGLPGRDQRYGFGRINAFNALTRAGEPIWILASWPPAGAIDARRPFEIDGSNPAGWESVDIIFAGDTRDLTVAHFAVTVDPPGQVPVIQSIDSNGGSVTVHFEQPLPLRAWTMIRHLDSGTSIRLGVLPADVNGDGTTAVMDLLLLSDAYTGIAGPLPTWSTDIDRNGEFELSDIVGMIDLMNGAGQYDVYLSESLPR